MWGIAAKHVARTLAVIALLFQALMPGMMASASTQSGDAAMVLCAMPADDTKSARSDVGAELAELISKKSQSAPVDMDHDCPACVTAQAATLPEPVVLKSPITGSVAHTAPAFEVRFAHVPRGPPVGSRAPPVSMKA